MPKTVEVNACIRPGCSKAQHLRGLCISCYNAIAKAVSRGLTTWDALEKSGRINKTKNRKRSIVIKWAFGKDKK